MKLEFSGHIFEKYSNIEFLESLSGGIRFPCGWTDERDEANCRFGSALINIQSSVLHSCVRFRCVSVVR